MYRVSHRWMLPLFAILVGVFIAASVGRSYGAGPSQSPHPSAEWTEQQVKDYLRDIHTVSEELARIRKVLEEQAKKH